MLPNEVFALECLARYAREGLVRDSTWEFAHCPYPGPKGQRNYKPGDVGYYLTHQDHQHQGLLQSVDVDRCCFFSGYVDRWLKTEPPGYEELNVIYKKYISGKYHSQFGVPHTEEWKQANSVRNKGALNKRSRPIVAIHLDGTKLYFESINQAAKYFEVSPGLLSGKHLKNGNVITRRKLKGWQFLFT